MITPIKTLSKIFMIPCYEDTKKKHKLYLFTGKVGTVPAPRIWFIDNLPEAGKLCISAKMTVILRKIRISICVLAMSISFMACVLKFVEMEKIVIFLWKGD